MQTSTSATAERSSQSPLPTPGDGPAARTSLARGRAVATLLTVLIPVLVGAFGATLWAAVGTPDGSPARWTVYAAALPLTAVVLWAPAIARRAAR